MMMISNEFRIPNIKGRVVIRGEVVVPKVEINRVNEVKRSMNKKEFSHPRNLVAGCLNKVQINYNEVAGNGDEPLLHLICYGLYSCSKHHLPSTTASESDDINLEDIEVDDDSNDVFPDSHHLRMSLLRDWGFTTCSKAQLFTSFPREIIPFIRSIQTSEEERESWAYEADGIVIKLNSETIQKKIGRIARSPRWAVAYKFWNNSAQTKLLDISFQIGRTGKAIPVGHLEPVTISGAVITKGTLHNVKFIEDHNIFPNRDVIVERSGGAGVKICRLAFPSLYSSSPSSSTEGTKYFCPCDKRYQLTPKDGDRYNLYCPDEGCKEKFCTLVEHFAGALNITGFGIGMIRDLIYNDIVRSISDLLSISKSKHRLVGLQGWGNIKIEKLVKSIDTAKKNARVADSLYSLSIPVCGKGMCETVSTKFPSLWELEGCASPQEIMSRGINEQCAINLFQFFKELREGSQPFIGSSLEELHSAGLNVGERLHL